MYLIDTNIHAAYLLQNFETDELTKSYLDLYEKIKLADRIVTDFILGEFETFIMQVVPSRYQLATEDKLKLKQIALDYIYRLTHECTLIPTEVETLKEAGDLFFENAQTYYISFVDSLTLAAARQHGYTIFTKDARMSVIADKLKISLYQP